MKTDQQLTQDVQDELHREPAVQAGQIQVQRRGGVVGLDGELPGSAQRWSAERALASHAPWGTPGVRAGRDQLQLVR